MWRSIKVFSGEERHKQQSVDVHYTRGSNKLVTLMTEHGTNCASLEGSSLLQEDCLCLNTKNNSERPKLVLFRYVSTRKDNEPLAWIF